MSEPSNAAVDRENRDPAEYVRPLPWFLIMFIGAMAMWGAFYIYAMPPGLDSSYGDQRTLAAINPRDGATRVKATADGKDLFVARCVACHQTTGEGVPGVFPPLSGSEWVSGRDSILIAILLHGVQGEIFVKGNKFQGTMPVFGTLDDADIAAILSYVRSNWGNRSPAISASAVKTVREETKGRQTPFSGGAELKALD